VNDGACLADVDIYKYKDSKNPNWIAIWMKEEARELFGIFKYFCNSKGNIL
jgi:hypothetical protein